MTDVRTIHRRRHGSSADAARPGRAGAAGRRRARRLSGRRLSGAARSRHRAGLDHRHLDRRHQCRADRRQCTRKIACRGCGNSGSGWSSNRSGNSRPSFPGFNDKLSYWSTVAERHSRFLPAQSAGPCRRPLSARRRQGRILLHRAAASRRSTNSSISSCQQLHAAPDGRRRACPNQPDAIFRQPR